ncbi:MAG: hypothetical protein KDK51_03655 [Deltaproteobacteria bacterium]|nr:hypothetical protein [Deltaproteobacteria bacterium]
MEIIMSLPKWAQWVTFFGSLLALLITLSNLFVIVKGPKLVVKFTKNTFIRISESYGESIFLRPIIVALNGDVTIHEVVTTLYFKDHVGNESKYNLEILEYGELVKQVNSTAPQHFFLTSSPFRFLKKNSSLPAVYLSRPAGHSDKLKNVILLCIEQVTETANHFTEPGDQSQKGTTNEARSKILNIIDERTNEILESVQFKPGEYEIELSVIFKSTNSLTSWRLRESSKTFLKFTIPENFRKEIKNSLKNTIIEIGRLRLEGKVSETVLYPEYVPKNINVS